MMEAPALTLDDSFMRPFLPGPSLDVSLPPLGDVSLLAADKMDSKINDELNFDKFNAQITSQAEMTAATEKNEVVVSQISQEHRSDGRDGIDKHSNATTFMEVHEIRDVAENKSAQLTKTRYEGKTMTAMVQNNSTEKMYNSAVKPVDTTAKVESFGLTRPLGCKPGQKVRPSKSMSGHRIEQEGMGQNKKRPRRVNPSSALDFGERKDTARRKLWSVGELRLFHEAVKRHETDFVLVASCIGTKKVDQVRSMFRKIYAGARQYFRREGMVVTNERGAKADLLEQVRVLKRWLADHPEELLSFANSSQDQPDLIAEHGSIAQESGRKRGNVKHRVQLVPDQVDDENLLRRGGFNPLVVVVLRGHRPLSDVSTHLLSKWSALLPTDSRVEILVELDSTATIDQVLGSLGNPEVFRMRYRLVVRKQSPVPVPESTLSRILNSDSFTFPASISDLPGEVLPLTCDDATDGMHDSHSNNTQDSCFRSDAPIHDDLERPVSNAFASIFQ